MTGPSAALDLTIDAELGEIGRVAEAVEAFCADNALDDGVAHALNLALDELIANTINHGYDDGGGHRIDISLRIAGDSVIAVLHDDGRAFDPTEAEAPDIDAALEDRPVGGLGIHFVRSMMDDIAYERVGGRNRLTLVKRIGA